MTPIITAGTLATLRALYVWVRWRGILIPDTHEYARGGFGLYPSPLGRVLGMYGETALAVVNMVACFGFASASLFIARREGKNLWIAGAIVLLLPASWWTAYASVDTTAAAVLLFAYLCWDSGRRTEAVFLAVIAAAIHLLIVPILLVGVVFWLARRNPVSAVLVVMLSISASFVLLLTPYGGLLSESPGGIGVPGIIGLVMAGAPFLLGYAFLRSERVAIAGRSSGPDRLAIPATVCVVGAAIACGLQRHFNMRYGLPALGFLAPLVAPKVGWVSGHLRAPHRERSHNAEAA